MKDTAANDLKQYREVKNITGDFMRVTIFPVHPVISGGRRKKNAPSRAAQEKLNQKNRENLAADILNLNFTRADTEFEVDFREYYAICGRYPDADDVSRLFGAFIRRLRRVYDKLGRELKYFYACELGHKGGAPHVHGVISAGISRGELKKLWGHGGVYTSRLYFDKRGVGALGGYTCKDGLTRTWYRTYNCSRNCIRPQKSGKYKSIYTNDSKIRQKNINQILHDPGDLNYIRSLYPGWEVAEAADICQVWDDEQQEFRLPTWGVYITLHLYKPEGVTDPLEVDAARSRYFKFRREQDIAEEYQGGECYGG